MCIQRLHQQCDRSLMEPWATWQTTVCFTKETNIVGLESKLYEKTRIKQQRKKTVLPATDNWVISIAPTHIHFAVSIPKATGSDYKNTHKFTQRNHLSTIQKTNYEKKNHLKPQCSISFNALKIINNSNS
jgi:hypothetical protein